MSKYTTGEIAELVGVSVRTVQYYDNRGILLPSELSEGGRRLYTDDDLKRMRIICFLREVGISINGISALFREKNPQSIISILLEQQEDSLRKELYECESRLELIDGIKRELKEIENFSVESIGDIANIMKQKNKLTKMRLTMLLTGLPVTAFQWTAIILWITHGYWWLFAAWACVAISWGIGISLYYFRHIAYICPECHEVFKSKFKEAFWAYHTPRMRRLTCPNCGRKGLCVEVYSEKEDKNNA
jgi:DNA-binding transcriptional MerR regulator